MICPPPNAYRSTVWAMLVPMSNRNDRVVYTTGVGRIADASLSKNVRGGDGIVRVRRETGGRGGKTVTTILGVPLPESALKDLAGELKRLCGTGGTVKDGGIEVQGDHRDKIIAALIRRGYTVKAAGG
jgi:translation initiation factor 1